MIMRWAIPARASRISSAPMNAHLSIDAESELMPSVATTTANVADITVTDNLLHGEEAVIPAPKSVWNLRWHIATQRVRIPALLPESPLKDLVKQIIMLKGQARSRLEPVFYIIKYRFHHRKLRFLGLKKNGAQHGVLFALADLIMLNPPCWPPEAAFAPKIGVQCPLAPQGAKKPQIGQIEALVLKTWLPRLTGEECEHMSATP